MKSGFTLTEFLVALLIVGVLLAVAIPSYLDYVKKSYYSEVVQTADRYKVAVTACIKSRGGVRMGCDAGRYGIPSNTVAGSCVGQVSAVTVVNGVIVVTPKAMNGINSGDTYILTPRLSAKKNVMWFASGGGCKKGLAPRC